MGFENCKMINYIYGLWDPHDMCLRYIGKSNNPFMRLSYHISLAKHHKGKGFRRINWIKSLLNDNLLPVMEILEECDEDNWQEIEKIWIKEAKDMGLDLVNTADGGQGFGSGKNNPHFGKTGTMFGKKHSIESRQKMSNAKKGKIVKETTKEKLSLYFKGRKRSKLTCENISKGRLGCKAKRTKSHNEKIFIARKISNAIKRNDFNLAVQLQEEYKLKFGHYNERYKETIK